MQYVYRLCKQLFIYENILHIFPVFRLFSLRQQNIKIFCRLECKRSNLKISMREIGQSILEMEGTIIHSRIYYIITEEIQSFYQSHQTSFEVIVLIFSSFLGLDIFKIFIYQGNCYTKLNQTLLININNAARACSKQEHFSEDPINFFFVFLRFLVYATWVLLVSRKCQLCIVLRIVLMFCQILASCFYKIDPMKKKSVLDTLFKTFFFGCLP